MRVKLLTFRYSATLGGFDDTPLADFIRDKEVLSFREHFFLVNEVPHLTCVLTYQDATLPLEVIEEARRTKTDKRSPRRTDPTEGLDEADRVLFNTLRVWRSETAKSEGVPPYVILTNKELLGVIKQKPQSSTALAHVPGLGARKIERHGAALLKALNGAEASK